MGGLKSIPIGPPPLESAGSTCHGPSGYGPRTKQQRCGSSQSPSLRVRSAKVLFGNIHVTLTWYEECLNQDLVEKTSMIKY